VPKFDRAELFDQKDHGLVPIHLATWQGLLFVHLADDPEPLVHPELCGVLSYRDYVTETSAHYSLQHSPLNDPSGTTPTQRMARLSNANQG